MSLMINRKEFLCMLSAAAAAPAYGRSRSKDEYYYIVAADPQTWWKAENTDMWKKTISFVNRLKPDFMIICGDLLALPNIPEKIDLKRAELMAEAYLAPLKELDSDIKIYNVAGNHDVSMRPSEKEIRWYEKRFGEPWYSFNHKGSLFIVLESNLIINSSRAPDLAKQQMKWLKKLLTKKKKYAHKTVYLHHPPFIRSISEKDSYHNIPGKSRRELVSLLIEHDVEIVFSGHLHGNTYAKYKGAEFISTASCCHSAPSGLRLVKVKGEKIIDKFYGFEDMPSRLKDMAL